MLKSVICNWKGFQTAVTGEGPGPGAGLPQAGGGVWLLDFMQERFHQRVR